ncbi:MAG: hypothetical protein LBT56_01560, partial [Prevotellaceae bacterium]|jgi:hypothetical protein|nr:hypothetical protein [Prevotellaceae bacterium]
MKTKKILLSTACALFISMSAFSQEVAESDTVKSAENEKIQEEEKSSVYMDGKSFNFIFDWRKKSKKTKPYESHWMGFGISLSYLSGTNDVSLGKSYSFFLNLMDYIVPLNRNFLLATGVGFDWQHYSFRGNVSLKSDEDGITRFVRDNNRNYKDSKFRLYHLTIPLIVEYQKTMKNGKEFFVSVGVEALIKTSSLSYAHIRTTDDVKKEKYTGLNIRPLNARFILRIGFESFSVLGYYQPFSIFEKTKGVDINPYGIGLMFNF